MAGGIAHENSIMCCIDKGPLQTEAFRLLAEFALLALALRYVANDRDHQQVFARREGTQAHLDRKLTAILSLAEQVQTRAHGSCVRRCHIVETVLLMSRMEALWQQQFNGVSQERRAGIPKERLGLVVYEEYVAGSINDHDAIRSQF